MTSSTWFRFTVAAAIGTLSTSLTAAAQSAAISPAHPRVLVVAYGFPRGSDETVAATEVRTALDTSRSAAYMAVVNAKLVADTEDAAGIKAIRSLDELKAFARLVRADVGIGISRVIGRGRTRLGAIVVYLNDSVGVPRIFAEDTTLVLAARALAAQISRDSVLMTRRCCY